MIYNSTFTSGPDAQAAAILDGIIDKVANQTVFVAEITDRTTDQLLERIDAGDPVALRLLRPLLTQGVHTYAKFHLKMKDRAVISLGADDRSIEVPSRYSVRLKNQDGSFAGGYQLPFWWDLSWADFANLLTSLSNRRDSMSQKIAALRRILNLKEQHSETATPGEACERAGIDPRDFKTEVV